MTKQTNPIETAVNEYLKAQGVNFAVNGGTPLNLDGWECDHWVVVFDRAGKTPLVSTYHTGIDHRELTQMGKVELHRAGKSSQRHIDSIKAKYSKPVKPEAASVLYSLLLDAQGAEQNFLDWCSEFGYDSDSMKAHGTYTACCEILQKVRTFFTDEERTVLQELLQDY